MRDPFAANDLFEVEEKRDRAVRVEEQTRMMAQLDENAARASAEARRKFEEGQRRMVLREYRAAGLEPPAGSIPVSLAVQLSMGCTIETIEGQKVLVRPNRPELEKQNDGVWRPKGTKKRDGTGHGEA